jgi:hypothetical protein
VDERTGLIHDHSHKDGVFDGLYQELDKSDFKSEQDHKDGKRQNTIFAIFRQHFHEGF